jgi:hypothetical protein
MNRKYTVKNPERVIRAKTSGERQRDSAKSRPANPLKKRSK